MQPRRKPLPKPIPGVLVILVALAVAIPATVVGKDYGPWALAQPVTEINIAGVNDGCPIESPDGRSLFIASNRTGTLGGNDIWVSTRPHDRAPWSQPVNLGAPINTTANDFCPTPLTGGWLLFVSERVVPGTTCQTGPGLGDIYITRLNPALGWEDPRHLGCDATGGLNFPGGEFGPSLTRTAQGTFLYFSSTGYGTDMNIYAARMRTDGTFESAQLVSELNTPAADFMPNVSADGLEIVFNSNRVVPGAMGGQDIYVATRASTADPWSGVTNLGPNINTAGNETRSSLSGDGHRLHFGRDGEVQVSTRETVPSGG